MATKGRARFSRDIAWAAVGASSLMTNKSRAWPGCGNSMGSGASSWFACNNVGRAPLDSGDTRDATGTNSFITIERKARHGSDSTGGLGDGNSWGAASTSSLIITKGRARHG